MTWSPRKTNQPNKQKRTFLPGMLSNEQTHRLHRSTWHSFHRSQKCTFLEGTMPEEDTRIKKDVAHSSLPQLLCNTHRPISGGSCHKYHFCHDKTDLLLQQNIYVTLWQRFCRNKHTFVVTKKDLFWQQTCVCHDKTFVATKNDTWVSSRQRCRPHCKV